MVHPSRQGLAASFVALVICSTHRQILAFNDVPNLPRDASRMSGQSDTTNPASPDDGGANGHNATESIANRGRDGALNQSKSEDSSDQAEQVPSESNDQAESAQTEAAQSLASSSYYYNQEEQHRHKERYKHHVSKRLVLVLRDR